MPRRRRIALGNLASAFPELTPRERRRILRRSWQHVGMTFVEACRVLARPIEDTLATISVEGVEYLRRVMDAHGRALILTAHLGNWELLALAPRISGYPTTIVARQLDAPWLRPLADAIRRKAGTELVDKRGALRDVLTALRRGHLIGILLDQNASRREGVFVPFFGRPASTSKSMALLALRTRTPVVPVFIRRLAGGRHCVSVHPPLAAPDAADADDAIVRLTMRCNEVIEAAIRAVPEQWLWIHDRWRTQPPRGTMPS